MSRPVAFVAFLALSWSHVAGLRCDMGEVGVGMASGHGGHSAVKASPVQGPGAHQEAATHHPQSRAAADDARMRHGVTAADTGSPPPAPDHGPPHGCLMIMACSIASLRPAHPAAMIRIPTVLVRAAFPAPPIPVAADLAVETPPPRHTV
ncbi:MAG: hypothetical protein OXQ93_17135 [Gemmatimonadota bacterium]|nr:hypothetical protein [Gemmatimonadota bacterium]